MRLTAVQRVFSCPYSHQCLLVQTTGTACAVYRTVCTLPAVFCMLFFEFPRDFQVGRKRRRPDLLCLVMYESHGAMRYSTFTLKKIAPPCGHV